MFANSCNKSVLEVKFVTSHPIVQQTSFKNVLEKVFSCTFNYLQYEDLWMPYWSSDAKRCYLASVKCHRVSRRCLYFTTWFDKYACYFINNILNTCFIKSNVHNMCTYNTNRNDTNQCGKCRKLCSIFASMHQLDIGSVNASPDRRRWLRKDRLWLSELQTMHWLW